MKKYYADWLFGLLKSANFCTTNEGYIEAMDDYTESGVTTRQSQDIHEFFAMHFCTTNEGYTESMDDYTELSVTL